VFQIIVADFNAYCILFIVYLSAVKSFLKNARNSILSTCYVKKKVKISLLKAVEAPRVARG
jgi:hypothetical protein